MWKQIHSTLAFILFLVSCQASRQNPPAIVSADPVCFKSASLIPFSFTPDSKSLAIRADSGVQSFNLKEGKEDKFIEASKPITVAALSADGKTLAWSFEDHSIQLIKVSDGTLLNTLTGHTDIVFKLRFSASNRLFSGSHDGTVRIWDSTGNLIKVIETGNDVLGFGVSRDETRLATIPFDGPVSLWDLNNFHKLTDVGGSGGFDTSDAVFPPDGKYLAADLATGLFIWRLSDGRPLWENAKNSMAVAFSPNGQYVAYSDINKNNQILLSSPDGARIIRTIEGAHSPVWELFFSPDSSMLAGTDGTEIRIWQVTDGTLRYIGKTSCP